MWISGLRQSSVDSLKFAIACADSPRDPTTDSEDSFRRWMRHSDWLTWWTRSSQSRANSTVSCRSLRLRKPSSSSRCVVRRASSVCAPSPAGLIGPRRRSAAPRGLPAATLRNSSTPRGGTLELGAKGRIFGCELFIRLAFDSRSRGRRRCADSLGVLQIRIDRGNDYARFNGDQVDAHEGHPDPGVDDDPLVEDTIEHVNQTAAAGRPFNCHRITPPWRAACALSRPHDRSPPAGGRELPLERPHLLPQLLVLSRQRLLSRGQMVIVAPPVQPDLLGFVDRTDEESDADGKELDLCQRNPDIAGHHEALVQDAVEHLDQPGGASVSFDNRGHRPGFYLTVYQPGCERPRAAGPPSRRSSHPPPAGPPVAGGHAYLEQLWCVSLPEQDSDPRRTRSRGRLISQECQGSRAAQWVIVFPLMGKQLPTYASASPARCPVL